MPETTSNQLPICLGIRHIYGRDNQKSDEKGPNRFGLKTRCNGTGGIFLSMCAKFGRFRRPRMANAPHSKPFATLMKLEKNICHLLYIFNSH